MRHLVGLVFLCVLFSSVRFHGAAGTGIQIVNTLNLADYGSRWISVSVFGAVYSFLSERILWWGSADSSGLGIYGARIPPQYAPNLAVIVGFGLNTQTGQNVAELYTYSNVTSTVSFAVFTLNTGQWTTPNQVSVPVRDYQYLVPDTDNLNTRRSLFLISLNHIVYIDIPTFTIVAELDLSQQFVNQYPVTLIAGATYYKGNLFIARTASLNGKNLAQIVDVHVENDFNFHSLSFSHVVYLDSDCDNMFGWGNYLFWPQLRNSNGTLYGWSLQDRNLIFASVGLGPGTIWGKAVGANQITNQAMLVSGNPSGGGYTAWVAVHDDQRATFIDSRPIPADQLPTLGIQTIDMNGQDDPQLSVLLAGHNATGFGKITWLRYTS